ncbi:alcohol dehydrogenase catalytic domain-containing protein [Alsobacter sp. SYSU M60028]|uniref:alcohol dehydrogenase n=1 Tax=Alsobacter ponti TaxID=2962936 RepID=A0ABT1LB98_9HYPH|nr:alcohol dehydrogenase catalytic domain-containing protein [Alsobacter ponti]MCP8938761.1 alcohol dehydrogenase catalytic domain-containing protein [Alsobacter ponti]
MRAAVVRSTGPAEAMAIENVPVPERRRHDVLIKVEACGVCFHDVVTRNGTMKRGVELPFIPGHEVSGEIVDVGPGVTQFKVGDRVATAQRRHICGHCRHCRTGRETSCEEREFLGDAGLNGGYAEFVCVEEDNVALVPPGVALDEASIVACAIGTELNAIRDVAKVRPGERVLVSGAGGGLGIHGIQLARLAGGIVIGVTTSPDKAQAIRDAGAHHVVLAARGGDFSREVMDVTDGNGVDVVIDNVGSVLFQPTRRSLAMGARWVFIGQLTGDFVQLNPAQIFMRDITIMSAKSTSREQLRDALDLVAQGLVRPVVLDRLPLEAACRAHELMEAGRTTGRILLKPGL